MYICFNDTAPYKHLLLFLILLPITHYMLLPNSVDAHHTKPHCPQINLKTIHIAKAEFLLPRIRSQDTTSTIYFLNNNTNTYMTFSTSDSSRFENIAYEHYIICGYCAAQVSKSAKQCPECGMKLYRHCAVPEKPGEVVAEIS